MVWAKLATMATAFGQTAVRRDGTVPDRLTRAWIATQSGLPEGWNLAGLRYTTNEAGTDVWVATATGPAAQQRSHGAADAASALEGLAASFDSPSR